jgi:membrane protease YdiL (CAAX protease family)
MPWEFALILFVLGVLLPWRSAARMKKLLARRQLATTDRLALYASTIAFQWAAVGIVAWRSAARGLSLRELGLAYPNPPLTTAILAGLTVLLSLSQIFALRRLARRPPERHTFVHRMAQGVMPHSLVESLAFVALVITVALCEEFLYRGFVLTVLAQAASGSLFVGALASSLLFALAHLYQGPRGLRSTFIVGLIFAVCRIASGSLVPTIVAHFLSDLVAGLTAPRLLAAGQSGGRVTGQDQTATARRTTTGGAPDSPNA